MSVDQLSSPVTAADVSVATDVAGLARLKAAARERSPEALEAVARQFESLFLEMMLKSMREASLGDGIFDSDAGQLYQGMFDKQVALDLSRGKGLGIADLLIRQLSPPVKADPKQPLDFVRERGPAPIELDSVNRLGPALQAIGATPAPGGARAPDAGCGEARSRAWRPATPMEFVREILPHARQAAQALGVHPLGLVAQAALETGWGRHVIAHEDGKSSFNLFGLKAGGGWQGARATNGTIEFEGGLPVRRQESFRSYGSIAESFADYVKLLSDSPRYREVLQAGADALGFAESLGRSGYATDPAYAGKIKGLLGGDTLRGALAALKNSGP